MTDSFDDETGQQMVSHDVWKGRQAFYDAIAGAHMEADPELSHDARRALPDQRSRLAHLLSQVYDSLSNSRQRLSFHRMWLSLSQAIQKRATTR